MSRRLLALVSLALLGAACANDAPRPAPLATADSVAPAAAAVDSSAIAAPDSAAPAVDSAGADTGATPAADARDTLAHFARAAGRTRHDSTSMAAAIRAGLKHPNWPTGPAPLPGAILPTHRVVAFYGNPLSKRMGVLGEYPKDEMLRRLDQEVARWRAADPQTPVTPALHLIAVVAQGAPGRDGKYRLRMDSTLIEQVYGWAQAHHALLFLDVQVGQSTLQAELPALKRFLTRPDVHLGIDPEFSMHYSREGLKPGAKIGSMSAADVNYASRFLADLVATEHLPPKILVVHRFTQRMLLDAGDIKLDPRVQVVIDMDGWGPPWLKFDSYRDYIVDEPVQFTGIKLFFHNDVKKGDPLLTPAELLRLVPAPLYIQYQ